MNTQHALSSETIEIRRQYPDIGKVFKEDKPVIQDFHNHLNFPSEMKVKYTYSQIKTEKNLLLADLTYNKY